MSIYLTPSLKEKVEGLADFHKRTTSNMIEIVLMEAVERHASKQEAEPENFKPSIAA